MAAEDRRVKRTKKAISDAVWSLMQEKNFEDLSVNDICERAEISRTTFYYYYIDKYDWLEKVIGAMSRAHFPIIGVNERDRNHFIELMTITHQNVADNLMYYAVLNKNAAQNRAFYDRLHNILMDVSRERCSSVDGPLSVEDDLKLHFLISVFLGVLQWWLQNDLPVPPQQLAELVYAIRFGLDK
ncbi:MAG: TetR family transcriptional regulator [Oscillospiraceae bacterium]|nr:TetR family transcriptional regulator [Oscillospiraceae bacterium]